MKRSVPKLILNVGPCSILQKELYSFCVLPEDSSAQAHSTYVCTNVRMLAKYETDGPTNRSRIDTDSELMSNVTTVNSTH